MIVILKPNTFKFCKDGTVIANIIDPADLPSTVAIPPDLKDDKPELPALEVEKVYQDFFSELGPIYAAAPQFESLPQELKLRWNNFAYLLRFHL